MENISEHAIKAANMLAFYGLLTLAVLGIIGSSLETWLFEMLHLPTTTTFRLFPQHVVQVGEESLKYPDMIGALYLVWSALVLYFGYWVELRPYRDFLPLSSSLRRSRLLIVWLMSIHCYVLAAGLNCMVLQCVLYRDLLFTPFGTFMILVSTQLWVGLWTGGGEDAAPVTPASDMAGESADAAAAGWWNVSCSYYGTTRSRNSDRRKEGGIIHVVHK
ncbi:hypothetical protein E8E14_008321 [Neopestalotiopsis sp. 37M]|nr:hypothetical protein E8E14_008321 [Neopestalotiopsis sp. 37M]